MKFSTGFAGAILLVSLFIITYQVNDSIAKPVESNDQPPVNLVKYENSNIGVDGYDFA